MSVSNDDIKILQSVEAMYQDPEIHDREYYQEFHREWDQVLKKAIRGGDEYLPDSAASVFTVEHSFGGFDLTLRFDQTKLRDWYEKERKRNSKTIFVTKRLKRSTKGELRLDESLCRYDPSAPEPTLTDEKKKNIIACALPGLPPELRVIYGNKWVNGKFGPFHQRSLSLLFLNTDYVPAFLGSAAEVAQYLFLMDCCIIKQNYAKVKDVDLKQYLHIFRPSPMLGIKGLI